MEKILKIEKAIETARNLHQRDKKIVLAGGCFDILHIGHIEFLEEAKKQGDYLFLLLESDEAIRKLKGEERPINSQQDRARVLAALEKIGFIILLPTLFRDKDYDKLITLLKPDTIATTKGDPIKMSKERQAKLVNGKVVEVVNKISNQSTSRLVKILKKDNWL